MRVYMLQNVTSKSERGVVSAYAKNCYFEVPSDLGQSWVAQGIAYRATTENEIEPGQIEIPEAPEQVSQSTGDRKQNSDPDAVPVKQVTGQREPSSDPEAVPFVQVSGGEKKPPKVPPPEPVAEPEPLPVLEPDDDLEDEDIEEID